ncbi:Dihydrosphingosine 1-phosphate phosphatase YSR3 [Hypsizygus marmoreus]|uniref:Dihydrosphingosine 1-phosphate phosphatase YSR3 n=1 Tax=Hypsizygus marmoreus TaxID=39966 RepID=A0A369JBL7_HYPMA|nr:Dihydrosphingosine 1-phosphate phosphatase YSR3 [Hypsizygus marmoreus]
MVQSTWNAAPAHEELDEPRLGRNTSAHFTVSVPGSENSSRAPSPAPFLRGNGQSPRNGDDIYVAIKRMSEEQAHLDVTPGRRPMDVYDATLPWWRAAIRRKLVKAVQKESKVIARMQDIIRTPWLDAYFVYTSSLGTHTFFMTFLPALFFFGYSEMGRGLLIVLAFGVYCSSFVKDLICSPRPFAPPVTRLTIGSHHLEYGFPSTHTTNCVSIALFFFGHVHRLASTPTTSISSPLQTTNSTMTPIDTTTASLDPIISPQAYTTITIILLIYTFSIVFGRIYTAMHSFTDCAVGLTMGAGIWWGHSSWSGIPVVLSSSNPLYWLYSVLWPSSISETGTHILHIGKGLGIGERVEGWVIRGGWEVPLILIPFCLLAVNQHPQPVDDCPCFEDAIAFGSVVLGSLVGKWAMEYSGAAAGVGRAVVMPGSGWVYELGQWVPVERTSRDVMVWWTFAALKMIVGILVIFIWRLLAKSALHLILPPTFRGLARVFSLPNRRFYTPATDYKSVPSDFSGTGLHAIPSVIDLPSSGGVGTEVGGIGSGVGGVSALGANKIKLRGGSNSDASEKGRSEMNGHALANGNGQELGGKDTKDGQPVKHYDADVLTKVVVYAGIAVLACELLPAMFEVLGWGVRSWI